MCSSVPYYMNQNTTSGEKITPNFSGKYYTELQW